MAADSSNSSGSGSDSSDSDLGWTHNDGSTMEDDEEAPAHQSLRGQTGLVTASCPRKHPRDIAERRRQKLFIPEDFSKEDFLKKFRRAFNGAMPELSPWFWYRFPDQLETYWSGVAKRRTKLGLRRRITQKTDKLS